LNSFNVKKSDGGTGTKTQYKEWFSKDAENGEKNIRSMKFSVTNGRL
jgi:hypothetical protein